MFCDYYHNIASDGTGRLIFQDIIDIITGETDTGNLSVDCDTANTVIKTDYYTSPWVVHDPIAATDQQIIKADQADSGDTKYYGILIVGASNPDMRFQVMSDWNEVAHTGTDYYAISNPASGYRTSSAGRMFIFASRECILIMQIKTSTGLYGNSEAGSNSDWGTFIMGEHTRGPATQIGDQPNWFAGSMNPLGGYRDTGGTKTVSFAYGGRATTSANVTQIDKPFKLSMGLQNNSIYDNNGTYNQYSETLNASQSRAKVGSVQPQDEDEAIQYRPEYILVGGGSQATEHASTVRGNVSKKCDIWSISRGSLAIGRFMNWNGKRYIVFKSGYITSTTGSTVGNKILVPYG